MCIRQAQFEWTRNMKGKINKVTIQVVQGDLLTFSAAAVVNDTNTDLALSPRLISLAGTDVLRETAQIGFCDVGSAVITGAGSLNAQKIIHTVGPRWGEGSERGKLASAVFECLQLAEKHQLKSIVFPAISTGALGYPLENCATTMLTQIIDFTFEDLRFLRSVTICLEDSHALEIFRAEFARQLDSLKLDDQGKVQV